MTAKRENFILILSSPSGSGKTTIAKRLLQNNPDLKLSVSVTTRPIRTGEVNGVDYHFIDEEKFNELVDKNKLIEHAIVFGRNYGTPRAMVEEILSQDQDVLFDIDWQGTQQIKQKCPEKAVSIFILPPSIEELEKRLMNRNSDSIETIKKRMQEAKKEISHWNEYDYVVVNDNVDECVHQVQSILTVERLKRSNVKKLAESL